jgi:hypothetical protein
MGRGQMAKGSVRVRRGRRAGSSAHQRDHHRHLLVTETRTALLLLRHSTKQLRKDVLGCAAAKGAAKGTGGEATAAKGAPWEAARAHPGRAAVHGRLAHPVVRGSLLLVAQHRVRLIDLLELLGVAALVWMLLQRCLSVGLFYLCG